MILDPPNWSPTMRKTLIACALLLTLPMAASASDICADIDHVSEGWDALSTLVGESEGDGFSADEVARIEQSVASLTEGSAALAGLLQGAGNEHQVALGKKLEEVLQQFAGLDGSAEVDYIVGAIDDVTNAVDAVTADCEAAQSE